jgi:uncharacterized hydantoinase/oxoprolinase family protein
MYLGIDYGANNVKYAVLDGSTLLGLGSIQRVRGQTLSDVLGDVVLDRGLPRLRHVPRVVVANSATLLHDTHRAGLMALERELRQAFPAADIRMVSATFNLVPLARWTSVPLETLIGTNFAGSAYYGASLVENGVVVDVGTSSTDVIGVKDGKPRLIAASDNLYNRLATQELWMAGGIYTYADYVAPRVSWHGFSVPLVPGVLRMVHVLYQLGLIDEQYLEREIGFAGPVSHHQALARATGYDASMVSGDDIRALAAAVLAAFRGRIELMVSHVRDALQIHDPQVAALGFAGQAATALLSPVVPPEPLKEPLSAYGAAMLGRDKW